MPLKSCVGASQGCQWWSSSELLPTTAGPRAARPIIGIVNTFIRRVALEAPLKMEDGIEQVMDTFMNGLRSPSAEALGAVKQESAASPV